jgi:hypothetical protein
MEKEVTAFEKLHATLVKGYLGEYVALHQGHRSSIMTAINLGWLIALKIVTRTKLF